MCRCAKPTQNGKPGYSWDGKSASVRPIHAPEFGDSATLIYDEPGRCSPMLNGKPYKIDHHSHHYRLFKDAIGRYRAFVAHGGGTEEFGNSYDWQQLAALMEPLDSDGRFIFFMSIESSIERATRDAVQAEAEVWRTAAAEKRIKTRKMPKGGPYRGQVKVWIEPAVLV